MPSNSLLSRLRPDPYILILLSTVVIASVLPATGWFASAADGLTKVAIALLFFFYGARLSTQETIEGLRNWRLHLTVFLFTFALFPVLGLLIGLLPPQVLSPQLFTGVLYLCLLPSTVQSSIAFTSTARGNVAAAICSASLSSIVGIFLTPLLVGMTMSTSGSGGLSSESIVDLVVQLLVPFLLGQVARRWIGSWAGEHSKALGRYDRSTIVLIVYTAFSQGVANGIWHQIAPMQLGWLFVIEAALLAVVLVSTHVVSRVLGFSHGDQTAIVFCGSKKSLASGLPMANVIFAGHGIGLIVLPVMLFHQMQLIVCAMIARRRGAAAAAQIAGQDAPPAVASA